MGMSETSATSITDEPEHSFVSEFISSAIGRKVIIWLVNCLFLGGSLYCLVTAFTSEAYVMLLPAFILASGLAGMIFFKPLDKKQRELQEQRERESEEATDMGLVA